MVFKGSRYTGTPVIGPEEAEMGGRRSLAMRSIPHTPGALAYAVVEGERLDHLANRFYSEPQKYWLILDANPDVLNPFDLLQTGRRIQIPKNRIVS
jgi:nucleoid-associated protein YgaU